ncbi:hypothetical protein [Micromonospora sp. WMMD980]|uniref:hypothetical protein n=1 Tax=Micromonospora sp. WMMD980 TaxID=3016088 RepID=UPI00241770CC|nr:hypothetical protein [Micromonospora sp. WMMD980]MDG4798993.1 hypothetical protein [Micromonospora sp. WMMD980]MDG4799003.1 hypothetical protein [Micromonospora sp. WMMD980]MDG4799069.1 hypothetical protein [Micromonospora sp. WMMD980]
MGLFSRKPSVPNTISGKQMADLSRRAQKANPQMFTAKAIKQRKASQAQQSKASQS